MTRRSARGGLLAALLVLPLLLAGCGGPAPPWTEPPRVAIDLVATASADTVPLLGEFEVRLDLFRRADLPVDFAPQVPEGFTGKVALGAETAFGPGIHRRAVLTLRPVRGPGRLEVPPFRAAAEDGTVDATTEAIPLEVTSRLQEGHGGALEAPGPLFPPRRAWLAAIAVVAGILLLAALMVFWIHRRRRRPARPPVTVALLPHVKALRELARLRASRPRTAAEIDAFYVAVSQVLRVYLEERFGLRAPERTTEEFLLEVETGGPLSAAQCLELRRFLQQCDLVKFARHVPAEEVHLQTLAAAELLIEATRGDGPGAAAPQRAEGVA